MEVYEREIEDFILTRYEELKKKYSDNSEARVILSYVGTINQNVIITATNSIERQLEALGEPLSLVRNISYTAIELLQNILFHSAKNEDGFHLSFFLIGRIGEKFFIHSSNLINTESSANVRQTLEEISQLDKKKLNKMYEKKLNRAELKGHKAGLGLMTLVLKSEGNINFNTEDLDNDRIMLNLEISY